MQDISFLLEEARKTLENGSPEEARNIARNRRTHDHWDVDLHLQWAALCEQVGLIDDLILELNLVLRDRPKDVSIHRRLAEIHQDNGNLEKAARKWKDILEIEPEAAVHYIALGGVFEEMKEFGRAAEIYRSGFEKTRDSSLKARLKSLEFVSEEVQPVSPEERDGEDWIPTDAQSVRFMDLFSGREGVYARQWSSPTGESGYTPIHEPFTLGVAKNHLMGNHTVGLYPLRMDNTVCFIAFDVDIAKFFLAKAITSRKLWERADADAQAIACRIVDQGAAHQLPVYIEDSGFKGRHCWIFLESPVPARVAKRFSELFLRQVGRIPAELQVECFPKQTFVPEGKLGNLIKLPIGIHRKSGRRGLFVNAAGEPFPNQLRFLDQVEKAPRQRIYEFVQRFQEEEISKIAAPQEQEKHGEEERPGHSLPPVPEEYSLERDPEFLYLISRCHVLRAIIEKINGQATLDNEERIVLTHSVGLLKQGPDAVNALLARCTNVDASFFLKSQLRGNPISCPKIRSRIPSVTSRVDCNCRFDETATLYPSPLRHVQAMDQIKSASLIGKSVDSLQFQQMLQEYLKARRQARELEILMKAYEDRLEEFFAQAGIDSVKTPMGTLKRTAKEGEKVSYHLEL